ncbi:DMT family transporter [Mesorhizobium sp. NZP2234]|uniref:DMT family transporter n=1 Tax=Mesorhizobium sp. NZP2234 TaxID=2483402 RepID=UPI001553A4E0|nr:DMT family transporter [Mesorhizobium sp. NZP2234]QKC92121.1 DMT family transporter [Mesorhizobium sp. NZP2234]
MAAFFHRLISPANANAIWIGIALMLLGNFFFALNDALGKILVASFSVGQVLASRAIGSFVILGPMLYQQGDPIFWKVDRPVLHVLRVALATIDSGLFYAAVVHLPLADVLTFYMAGPIYVAAMSHVFLGERLGWRRWLAILAGFGGVVIALDPSSASLTPDAIYPIAGSISYSVALMLNKVLSRTSDTTLGVFQMTGALIGGMAFAVFDWITPSPAQAASMLLLGIVGCLAHLMITRAIKLAPVSMLAPFQYTLLLWGIVLGVLVFGDVPGSRILAGACIIVFAGLFIFHRKVVRQEPLDADTVPRDVP